MHGKAGLDGVAEHHGCQVAGEAAGENVVLLHALDVAVAGHRDAVFGTLQLYAQIAETLVGFQIRVSFRDHHQTAQRAAQFALRRLEFFERFRIVQRFGGDLDSRRFGPRLDHLGQSLLFKRCFAFHGGDDVGHQVGAALVLV